MYVKRKTDGKLFKVYGTVMKQLISTRRDMPGKFHEDVLHFVIWDDDNPKKQNWRAADVYEFEPEPNVLVARYNASF